MASRRPYLTSPRPKNKSFLKIPKKSIFQLFCCCFVQKRPKKFKYIFRGRTPPTCPQEGVGVDLRASGAEQLYILNFPLKISVKAEYRGIYVIFCLQNLRFCHPVGSIFFKWTYSSTRGRPDGSVNISDCLYDELWHNFASILRDEWFLLVQDQIWGSNQQNS